MIAGTWLDPIVGVDIHWVLVPAPPAPAPIPTPLPHPFVGIVYDPMGLAVGTAISAGMSVAFGGPITGPVLINSLPASNTGTEGTNKMVMPHIPTPPGVGWAPVPAGLKPPIPGKAFDPGIAGPVPSNDAVIVTGSKTVYINGTNATRLGDLAMSCGEPIRLPSSAVIAVPKGAPVLIGGPPTLDFMAAAMGAIRTSWVSGRLNAIASRVFGEGSRAARWANKIICFFTGHPVDVATGMVMTESVDFHLPGPVPLAFERTYYSRSTYRGPLGLGWGHTFDQWITFEGRHGTYHDGDGRDIDFELPADGATALVPSEGLRVVVQSGRILVSGSDGRRLVFTRASGAERYVLDRMLAGNEPLLTLRRDPDARLVELLHVSGRSYRFSYDEHDRITLVTGPRDTDGMTVEICAFEYDTNGNLVRSTDAHGECMLYEYAGPLLVAERDRRGMSFYFAYDGADADARCVRTWGDGGVYDHLLQYDLVNGLTIVTNSLDQSTLYYWDHAGRVVKVVDPLGGERTLAWSDDGCLVEETDTAGAVTAWSHDGQGRVTALARADGASIELGYDDAGEIDRYRREDGEVVRVSRVGASQVRIETTWGAAAAITVDAGDRPVHVQDASGLPFTIERTEGSPTVVSDGSGRLARLGWSASGRLAAAEVNGVVRSYHYDALGRTDRIGRSGAGPIDLQYDAEGNVLSVADGGETRVRLEYGQRNRVVRRIVHGGPTMLYRYDTEGRLLAAQADGIEYRFEHDAAGRVIRETTPQSTTRSYAYAGDRVVGFAEAPAARPHGLRRSHALKHDGVGRILSRTVAGGPEQTFEYDVLGRMVRAIEADSEVRFEYDPFGNLVREIQDGFEVRQTYDPRGKRVRRETSSGSSVELAYDPRGRLSAVMTGPDRPVLRLVYDAHGRLRERIYHDAASTVLEYDAAGRLRSEVDEWRDGRSGRVYQWDEGNRVARWRDSESGELRFHYGPGGRLERVEGDAAAWQAEYDRYGRRGTIQGLDLGLDLSGRVMPEIGFTYDELGRVVERRGRIGTRDFEQSFEYDGLNRVKAARNGPDEFLFSYDALGRLVRKATAHDATVYRWEGAFLLEQEGRRACRQFLMDDMRPLAVVRDGVVLAFNVDWRGLPRALYDADGQRAWNGELWLAGADGFHTPDQPFGWPGNRWDADLLLWFNLARCLDPITLRFLTPDPLGLEGGLDPYAFVSDPNRERDPLGLILDVQSGGGYSGYPPPEFRGTLEEYRRGRGTSNASNIAILDMKDGSRHVFVSGEGGHSERQMLAWMDDNNIRASQISRIYTELMPCTRVGGCFDLLRARFEHLKTRIPVIFNFPWRGDQFDGPRNRAIEDFKATCK